MAQGDPWAKYHMENIPAERVIRHLYHPETKTWTTDETIVKCEKEPFTHGAMRFCYRLKKRSPPPNESSNHRFHSYGWTRASNFVAKAYQKDGQIDTSDEAKQAVRNDIMLQYEAQYWAEKFNAKDPPKKLVFIRAYAMEFPDRPGAPWLAVERFIAGTDSYGCGFTKHNTNAGFVDEDLHRVTPQVFSAFSFYASHGDRIVADIQGVGDLYTDPQVLSSDYRFGDGDLGPRGMALFFKSFRHNTLADSLGIPVFALSKNELKHQAKYEDDLYSMSADSSYKEAAKILDKFAAMDLNRNRRQSMLMVPPQEILPEELQTTEKRSNESVRDNVRQSIRNSLRFSKPVFSRTTSDIDEVTNCLNLAKQDFLFDNKVFHRKESGEMMTRPTAQTAQWIRSSFAIRTVSNPIKVEPETRGNLGKVHYQLAVLHGLGRFPDVVPSFPDDEKEDIPPHDAFSVLFHLAHASSLGCVAACLALGRLHAGLGTCVSPLLDTIVPIDFDAAETLLRRAMQSKFPPAAPKVAAGCLLYQIYLDTAGSDILGPEAVSGTTFMQLLEDILTLMAESHKERQEIDSHRKRAGVSAVGFHIGDRVEGNYCLEGTYYPGVVESVSADGHCVVVKYDDDGSTESLTREHVRLVVPPTATQTDLGGPLSDEEALGMVNSDEKFSIEPYELRAELARLKAKVGDKKTAAALYEVASNEAMTAGKMKKASEWSLRAAELLE